MAFGEGALIRLASLVVLPATHVQVLLRRALLALIQISWRDRHVHPLVLLVNGVAPLIEPVNFVLHLVLPAY